MKTMTSKTGPSNPLNGRIPPLEPGDRLTRAEFERRYEAMPNLRKAELIEGVVYVTSPVRADYHGVPQSDFVTWLGVYRAFTPGVKAADNATVRLDLGNEPQPDGVLYIEPAHGGQVRISKDGYIEGARNWSARSPPAASASICTTNSAPISATASVSTSSGASLMRPSIGSCSKGSNTGRSERIARAFCGARYSLVCGLTRRHCCVVT